MRLKKFRIRNYRSVNDSGDVEVDRLTSLVGRNESGKTNLLLALASLNPPGGVKPLNAIKDFPRGRRLEECKDDTHVVESEWELTDAESAAVSSKVGGHAPIKTVTIGRNYKPPHWVGLEGLQRPTVTDAVARGAIRKIDHVAKEMAERVADEGKKTNILQSLEKLAETNSLLANPPKWATAFVPAAEQVRTRFGEASIVIEDGADHPLRDLEQIADRIANFDKRHEEARSLVVGWLPTFIYTPEFPELSGHQNLDEFVNRRGQTPALKESEDNFDKLAKVADFTPATLHANINDHETRSQILNRAGALVTAEIRRLWKDRALLVRFNLDGVHLDILVSDPNAYYPVEVNLDERSRGFKWFFSFYIAFSADTHGGKAAGAILLLDEPGLFLHAMSQGDLLKHLREDFKNQIVYTTHSPFMVPADDIPSVRTVEISPEHGTTVTTTPTGDAKTLFPLQAALGYHLSQTLFIGHSNLVVEGVTDFWILSALSNHVGSAGGPALPADLTIMPVGGAGKVTYMAALLASQELGVLVLLDDDRAGRDARQELVRSKLVKEMAITFVTEGFQASAPSEADIEDLLDPNVYDRLVQDTYKAELAGKSLALNLNVPRIVPRYEKAFEAIGLTFNKTRPAREFLAKMGSDPASVLTIASRQRFETLFGVIAAKRARIARSH